MGYSAVAGVIMVGGETGSQIQAGNGSASMPAPGDSGGPLIVGGALVGTVSGGGQQSDGTFLGFYVDINSAEVQALIAAANQDGAGIGTSSGTCK